MAGQPVLFLTKKQQSAQTAQVLPTIFRQIEQWGASLTAGGGGGGGLYASLTGPGETVTPGALTQAGGFTITDVAGDGISMITAADNFQQAYGQSTIVSAGVGVFVASTASTGIVSLNAGGGPLGGPTGSVQIQAVGGGVTVKSTGEIQLLAGSGLPTIPVFPSCVVVQSNSRTQIVNGSTAGTPPSQGIYLHDTLGQIRIDGNTVMVSSVLIGTTGDRVGFFNTAPVTKQSATDLATLLTAMTNYGLI